VLISHTCVGFYIDLAAVIALFVPPLTELPDIVATANIASALVT